jgi:HlyD family secretion protein
MKGRIFSAVFLLALAAGIAYVYRPRPVPVDVVPVERGPMQVTIDESGQTRAHDRFTLAAPVSGFLSRIVQHEGDRVSPATVLATISPPPLDPREESETRARIASAEAQHREAVQQVLRLEAGREQTQRDLARAEKLIRTEDISRQQFEQAQNRDAMAAKELEAAKYHATSAEAEVERARAGLISLETQRKLQGRDVAIKAPFEARILRILEKSERVVPAGTPIAILSNPGQLEIVADLLSTDAVKVKPGATVWVDNWGGDKPLRARLRTVEPYGFTKVSALGVEEQRVSVIADFLDPHANLGDGYRVEVRIVIWETAKALHIPASCLFRKGADWYAFTIEAGVARQTRVEVSHRNELEVEIINGLSEGEKVILHPSNDVRDGSSVAQRAGA